MGKPRPKIRNPNKIHTIRATSEGIFYKPGLGVEPGKWKPERRTLSTYAKQFTRRVTSGEQRLVDVEHKSSELYTSNGIKARKKNDKKN